MCECVCLQTSLQTTVLFMYYFLSMPRHLGATFVNILPTETRVTCVWRCVYSCARVWIRNLFWFVFSSLTTSTRNAACVRFREKGCVFWQVLKQVCNKSLKNILSASNMMLDGSENIFSIELLYETCSAELQRSVRCTNFSLSLRAQSVELGSGRCVWSCPIMRIWTQTDIKDMTLPPFRVMAYFSLALSQCLTIWLFPSLTRSSFTRTQGCSGG